MTENDIEIIPINETYSRIKCDSGVAKELSEYFKFRVPGYYYMKAYKANMWDGYIRLFDVRNNTIYKGLTSYIPDFCRRYQYIYSEPAPAKIEINDNKLIEWIESMKIPFPMYDHQFRAVRSSIQNKRQLILSATGSGKSLIIYTLARYFKNKKVLVIVPTISLVHQMVGDFELYSKDDSSFSVENNCHKIWAGQEKNSTGANIYVSTWQSLYKLDRKYFEQFDVVVGDECHQFKSDSLKSIMEKCVNAQYRFGTTGTLEESKTHRLVLEGLFGKVFVASTTDELMKKNLLSQLSIVCVQLQYPEIICKEIKKVKYVDEINFLIQHKKRNSFIANLAIAQKDNTLILFQFVEKHGKLIYEEILRKLEGSDRKVFFIHGKIDSLVREEIRKITETEKDAILVASSGVFSTGINIKNLENIIFASSTKSKIKTLQSIGRSLRIGRSSHAVLYDIVDDLCHKNHKNYAMKHFIERLRFYNNEKFKYKIGKVSLTQSMYKINTN